eukprot:1139220-Pelagomonas_calceolata.AAC.3
MDVKVREHVCAYLSFKGPLALEEVRSLPARLLDEQLLASGPASGSWLLARTELRGGEVGGGW